MSALLSVLRPVQLCVSQGRRDNSTWGFSNLWLVPDSKGAVFAFPSQGKDSWTQGAFLWPKGAGWSGLPESRGAKDRMQGSCVHRRGAMDMYVQEMFWVSPVPRLS